MSLFLVESLELEVSRVVSRSSLETFFVSFAHEFVDTHRHTVVSQEEGGSYDWNKVERQSEEVSNNIVLPISTKPPLPGKSI